MTINEAFDGKVDFEITKLVNDDGEAIEGGTISFEYARPEISIDNKARYVTHDIIGGKTVRQKIGEEPREVSISGIVIEETATQLDKLRNANTGRIKCDRLPSGTMNSQFPSVSTSPMSSGGSARIEDGELLYRFDMKAIEVERLATKSSNSSNDTNNNNSQDEDAPVGMKRNQFTGSSGLGGL
jgi:hypothetical protein